MLPAQSLRPENIPFVLATESKVLSVVAMSATIICFVFPGLIQKTKKINTLCYRLLSEAFKPMLLLVI